jgi:hypothetical protein
MLNSETWAGKRKKKKKKKKGVWGGNFFTVYIIHQSLCTLTKNCLKNEVAV